MQNNYSGLINFEIKKSETVLCIQFWGDVANMRSRRVLERYLGGRNHCATWGV